MNWKEVGVIDRVSKCKQSMSGWRDPCMASIALTEMEEMIDEVRHCQDCEG